MTKKLTTRMSHPNTDEKMTAEKPSNRPFHHFHAAGIPQSAAQMRYAATTAATGTAKSFKAEGKALSSMTEFAATGTPNKDNVAVRIQFRRTRIVASSCP